MAGVGHYKGETSIALGLAHHKNNDVMFHGGLAYNKDANVLLNAGVSVRFGHNDANENDKNNYGYEKDQYRNHDLEPADRAELKELKERLAYETQKNKAQEEQIRILTERVNQLVAMNK